MNQQQSDQLSFNISEVSKLIDVVPATIRNWEKEGLISPARLANGYRSYTFLDIERLKKIKQYSSEKMGLSAIKHILKTEDKHAPEKGDVPQISKKLLGKKWRETRLNKGLSIEEVAQATDVSVSYLSKIENAQANVSYDVLQRVANFYGENILYYYVSQNHTPRLVRHNEGEKFTIDVPGVVLETISTGNLAVVKYTIAPHSGRESSQSHNGSELVYILEGSIDYTMDDHEFYQLHQGDAFHFNSEVKHRWFNNSDQTTVLLWIYITESEQALE